MAGKRGAGKPAGGSPAKKEKSASEPFLNVFDQLVEDVIGELDDDIPEEAKAYVRRMCVYTCKGGKMTRGLTVGMTLEAMLKHKGESTSEELTLQGHVVGWGIEWLQACFLVLDDIMDDSITRRGQPCWYKNKDVGKMAINDGLILESCIYILLKKHCGRHKEYSALVDIFHQVATQTEMGQLLDMTTEDPEGKLDFTRFTMKRYKSIVKFKTAFYSFYLPVASGLILAGVNDEEAFKETRDITLAMGEYFQIQDDVLDCYADPETLGKIGTDIQDKKCSWLCVKALEKATPAQMKVLEGNYGQWDDAKVANVKALYREMKLKEDFEAYEEESYQSIKGMIEKTKHVPKGVFEQFLAKIYKRKY